MLNNPLVLIDPDGRQIRADLGDFNPFGPYGDYRRGADGTVERRADYHEAQVKGALIGLSFVTAGVAGGVIGTLADVATGSFTPAGAVLNFLPGGRVADEVVDGGRVALRLGDDAAQAGAKVGSAGGPGAGKRFSAKIKDAAEGQAGGRCVFCGRETTRTPGGTQRNTDHAIPASRGGNNALDNAQNTCRDCNLNKRSLTTVEYIRLLWQLGRGG